MSTGITFKYKTRKLPCRKESFQIGRSIGGAVIREMLSIDAQKTVFLLSDQTVLSVRHHGRRLPQSLCTALQRPVPGLVEVVSAGTLEGDWFTVDRFLRPLPAWNTLDENRKRELVRNMADCVDQLHSLGYCHLDIKPEHFGLDHGGNVRLIDMDSALGYTAAECTAASEIEYTPGLAPAEVINRRYSTASDYYCLGKTIELMMGRERNPFWQELVRKLTYGDMMSRMNHTQLVQTLVNSPVESNTGPRCYTSGKRVGVRIAFSDRQLALYLSQNYEAACAYTSALPHKLGESESTRVARVIHMLDPTAPLCWYGQSYASTREIGTAMSSRYPQQNEQMIQLLASGILLQFREVEQSDSTVKNLLERARQNPQGCYWDVCRCFGGRHVVTPTAISLTNLSAKLKTVDELLGRVVRRADPAAAATVLSNITEKPSSRSIDTVIAQLQSLPQINRNNLTNITSQDVFGKHIVTQLPEPGSIQNVHQITDVIPSGTYYIIDEQQFQDWTAQNEQVHTARKERNIAILKVIGWVALGAVILCLLPYILAVAIIIGIIALLLGL